jgi:DNA repair protein RadD
VKLKPREHQEEAVQSIFDYYASGKTGNPIIVAATAAGKSLMIAFFIKRAMTEFASQRIVMATHVKELIENDFQKIVQVWPDAPVGIYSAGVGKKQAHTNIVCGGVQSMYKQAQKLGYRSLMIIDECDLVSPDNEGMYM